MSQENLLRQNLSWGERFTPSVFFFFSLQQWIGLTSLTNITPSLCYWKVSSCKKKKKNCRLFSVSAKTYNPWHWFIFSPSVSLKNSLCFCLWVIVWGLGVLEKTDIGSFVICQMKSLIHSRTNYHTRTISKFELKSTGSFFNFAGSDFQKVCLFVHCSGENVLICQIA